MLRLDLELDGMQEAADDLGRAEARVTSELAQETERSLRRRNTLWPQDTGFSRDRFRVEDDHSGGMVVTNTADYAPAVNNRSTYPLGGANPNYRSVERTVKKFWSRIVAAALKKAFPE